MLKDAHGARYEIKDNRLIIKRLQVEDEGTYTCKSDTETAQINVVGMYLKMLINDTWTCTFYV